MSFWDILGFIVMLPFPLSIVLALIRWCSFYCDLYEQVFWLLGCGAGVIEQTLIIAEYLDYTIDPCYREGGHLTDSSASISQIGHFLSLLTCTWNGPSCTGYQYRGVGVLDSVLKRKGPTNHPRLFNRFLSFRGSFLPA
jgi:hypothetical protein